MSRAGAWVVAIAVAGLTLALTPTSASAATCADHPNQASAQRAKDTRDAGCCPSGGSRYRYIRWNGSAFYTAERKIRRRR